MAAVLEKRRCRKYAVAEIGFRDGAETGDGPSACHVARFRLGHMGSVDQAPALIDRHVGEQPFDGTCARPRDTVLDLFRLLGDMDVDRASTCHRQNVPQFFRRRGPQTVRRDAELAAGKRRRDLPAFLHQRGKAFDRVDEASLALRRCHSPETGAGVEDWQQGEADPGRSTCRTDPRRVLRDIGVVAPVTVVMQVMKLADPGKARLQHFHIELCGDRLDIVRCHRQGEFVHQRAPAPEAVAC